MFHSILSVFQRHGAEERRGLNKSYQNTKKAIEATERLVIDRIQAHHDTIMKRFKTKIKPNSAVEVEAEVVEEEVR